MLILFKWLLFSLFFFLDPTFQLVSGCNDIIVDASLPVNFTIPQPEYQSISNDTILGSCVPSYLSTIGSQIVNCTATDNEAFSLSCQFNVTVTLPQDEDIDIISSQNVLKGLSEVSVVYFMSSFTSLFSYPLQFRS